MEQRHTHPAFRKGYVVAIVAELTARNIAVGNHTVHTRAQGCALAVGRGPGGPGQLPAGSPARLLWSDQHGWSLQAVDGDDRPAAEVYFAITAVPPPGVLADWVMAWLAHPNIELDLLRSQAFDPSEVDEGLRPYGAGDGG